MAGNCITLAVLSCFLLKGKFPRSFIYQGKQFVSSDLLLSWGLIGLVAGVLSLLLGYLGAKIADDQHAEVKSLEDKKQGFENQLKQEDAYKELLHAMHAEFFVQMQRYLTVRARPEEMSATLQLASLPLEVVELTVDDDMNPFVFVRDGLIAGREVNNA